MPIPRFEFDTFLERGNREVPLIVRYDCQDGKARVTWTSLECIRPSEMEYLDDLCADRAEADMAEWLAEQDFDDSIAVGAAA